MRNRPKIPLFLIDRLGFDHISLGIKLGHKKNIVWVVLFVMSNSSFQQAGLSIGRKTKSKAVIHTINHESGNVG